MNRQGKFTVPIDAYHLLVPYWVLDLLNPESNFCLWLFPLPTFPRTSRYSCSAVSVICTIMRESCSNFR